ncbi:hypothetical protein AGRA3207_002664 [Actinomadura graeca]|uniref:Secreted protein n=1 Tax=Actinomadura graeca TaxID=2750812 RepID=A0ABX8QWE8_9ACTN|nr:hypothetical protein [Actinomadura graeca]QXJ21777.1 hypothetical protein AGRA3207_002664 [Actinomadura graeca]
MRRIATVTISTGLALTGLGAPPARASATTWATTGAYKAVAAGGTYERGSGKVTISGWLQDDKANGWAAAVQFRTTEGDGRHTSEVYFFLADGTPADLKYRQDYGKFFTSDYTTHLYARECGVTPDKKRTTKCADWQKIY